jgi:beta-1,4-galactosyltransferase 1
MEQNNIVPYYFFLVSVRLVNGFSNLFWGWGGEDDDMANRLRIKKLFISRYPANIARYPSFRR